VRDAKYTRRTTPCTEPAWALQNSQAIGQICEKPWKNQGFAAERTGTEQLSIFSVFLRSSRGAENDWLDLSITGNTLETSTAT
jgi:hypothetical protein